jgi:hypothetical protein
MANQYLILVLEVQAPPSPSVLLVTTTGIPNLDIESLDQFDRITAAGATSIADWRVQSVDLTARPTPVRLQHGRGDQPR